MNMLQATTNHRRIKQMTGLKRTHYCSAVQIYLLTGDRLTPKRPTTKMILELLDEATNNRSISP